MHTKTLGLKVRAAMVLVVLLTGASGCLTSRTDEYFVDLTAGHLQPTTRPIEVALVLALPERELQKPTALNPHNQTVLLEHIAHQLRQTTSLEVKQVLPTMIVPGDGRRTLSLERLRDTGTQAHATKLLVVVASSTLAQRVQPYPLIETQLFARMDLALVDLTAGQVLLTETGQEDYLLGERRDVEKTISYPRIYYRTQTTTGPFTVVEGDPRAELGKISFTAAADQLVLRLQERLKAS